MAHGSSFPPPHAVTVRSAGPALLVEKDCYLASLGGVTHRRMCLQASVNSEQLPMVRVACLPGAPAAAAAVAAGEATVFLQAGGTVIEKTLAATESMYVTTACVVALTEGITIHPPVPGAGLVMAPGGPHAVYGAGLGWGLKTQSACVVRGPGKLYLSNLPVSRVAGKIVLARADAFPVVRLVRALLVLAFFFASLALMHTMNMLQYEPDL